MGIVYYLRCKPITPWWLFLNGYMYIYKSHKSQNLVGVLLVASKFIIRTWLLVASQTITFFSFLVAWWVVEIHHAFLNLKETISSVSQNMRTPNYFKWCTKQRVAIAYYFLKDTVRKVSTVFIKFIQTVNIR